MTVPICLSAVKSGRLYSIAVAAIALCFSVYFNFLNNDTKKDDEKYKVMQEQISTYKQILDEVRKENTDIKSELDKMKKNQPTKKP